MERGCETTSGVRLVLAADPYIDSELEGDEMAPPSDETESPRKYLICWLRVCGWFLVRLVRSSRGPMLKEP